MILSKTALEKIVEKGQNAGYQHFLLFPQFFPLFLIHCASLKLSSASALNLGIAL